MLAHVAAWGGGGGVSSPAGPGDDCLRSVLVKEWNGQRVCDSVLRVLPANVSQQGEGGGGSREKAWCPKV